MSELTNPHDKFFKETFSRPEVARSFLQQYLPSHIVPLLDLDNLYLEKDSFIDPDLQEYFSDLLYRVPLRDGRTLYVYLLLEHKSYSDPLTAFQLLRYMVRFWERRMRQKQTSLEPIIPLVVYHGRERWGAARNLAGLYQGPEEMRGYLPDFRYELCDLTAYSDEEIRGEAQTQIVLRILRYIFDRELGQRLPEIFRLFGELANQETALEYLETVLRYLSVTAEKVTLAELQAAVETAVTEPRGDVMATLAQQWLEQGRQEGLETGMAKGLETGMAKGLETGMAKGLETGMAKGLETGMAKGLETGMAKGLETGMAKGLETGMAKGLVRGLEQGREVGLEQGLRRSILDILELRIGQVPIEITTQLEEVSHLETLRLLLRRAATVDTLAEFQIALTAMKTTG